MGGGSAEGYYAGSFYTGIGLVVIALLNMILYLVAGESVSLLDLLAIASGGLGVAAGKMQNKALLIAYMVLAILTAIAFGAAILPFSALAAGCGIVNDMVQSACVNDAGEQYCCFACAAASDCGSSGCLWVPAYNDGVCYPPEGETLPQDPCDKDCCDGVVGASWSAVANEASCTDGTSGQLLGTDHGQGTCETTNDVDTKEQCSVDFTGTYSNKYILDTGGPASYTNAGCHIDTEGGGADSGLCDYTGIIWITIFITLAVAIAGSVMGCCVVCCGNDELSKEDDSG